MPLQRSSNNPLERPQAQFYDDLEEITIIPDPSRTTLIHKMREFLEREHDEGQTTITLAITQLLDTAEIEAS